MTGFYQALQRLVPSHSEQDAICDQLTFYQNVEGIFGMGLAIRHKKTKAPGSLY